MSIMALRAVRKMCAVIPHHLGKGGPLRASRCIPPGSWRGLGIEPCRASEPYRRFITRGEITVLPAEDMPPAPIDMKGVSPPLTAPTRQTWSLPAPPAPDHGGTSAVPSRSGSLQAPRDPMANRPDSVHPRASSTYVHMEKERLVFEFT